MDFLIVPKPERRVTVGHVVAQIIDPALSMIARITSVGLVLQADSLAGIVLGADIERQIAGLATVSDEVLAGVELALGDVAATFENVAPTAKSIVDRISWIRAQKAWRCSL